jgi:hypothetical protein
MMTVLLSSTSSIVLFLLVFCSGTTCQGAFLPLKRRIVICNKLSYLSLLATHNNNEQNNNNNNNNNNEDDNMKLLSLDLDLDDVTPPTINLKRESILFGENPETRRNNIFLATWKDAKATLPPIITGVRQQQPPLPPPHLDDETQPAIMTDTTTLPPLDEGDPVALLYNMVFVRGPTIAAGLVYAKNVITGHPLIVDIGDGPFEVSPIIVLGVLYAILRVP